MTDNLGYRLPPQNIEAEQCVLGAVLLEGGASFEVVDMLDEDDFYRDAHKKVFSAVKRLVEKNEPVDLITLQDELKRVNELEAVGGVGYLSEVLALVPTAANATYYAKIVRDKAMERKLLTTCTSIVNDIYNSGYDTDTLVNEAEGKIYSVKGERSLGQYFLVKDVTKEYFKKIEDLYQKGENLLGVSTGYKDIDQLTGGFKPGQLIIIAARPSMGKTALAMNFARNSAIRHNNSIAVFSLEMSKEEVLGRLIGSEARIDITRLTSGRIEENEWGKLTEAASRLSESMIFIDDTSSLTPGEIRSRCRRIKAQYGKLDMVIVDYLQLMRPGIGSKSQNREQEIADISRTLKALAKEMHIPVIALSQLNREVDKRTDKRPFLSDLRESGAIEQDADMIIFIYRDEVYHRETESPGIAEIIFSKNRSGPQGLVKLTWLSRYTSFENYIEGDGYNVDISKDDFN
ncbi:MAG: replicative DNA helicase [Proteobacteria bacterium]|nr:replicative DNA helicase [Pseudomonadota bacterium]